MTKPTILTWLLSVCMSISVTTSCGTDTQANKEQSKPLPPLITKEQIKEIYSLYIQKDYAAYADEMLSCDDKPESYKRQIAILLEQHATEHAEEEGNVTGFEVNTIKPQANGQAAEVYLNITYANGNTEEIQLLFIHDGLRWRLR